MVPGAPLTKGGNTLTLQPDGTLVLNNADRGVVQQWTSKLPPGTNPSQVAVQAAPDGRLYLSDGRGNKISDFTDSEGKPFGGEQSKAGLLDSVVRTVKSIADRDSVGLLDDGTIAVMSDDRAVSVLFEPKVSDFRFPLYYPYGASEMLRFVITVGELRINELVAALREGHADEHPEDSKVLEKAGIVDATNHSLMTDKYTLHLADIKQVASDLLAKNKSVEKDTKE
ncbi:hypothetical protein, partial [Nocardia sp. NPDC057030]|uniref:hypothetical protein n=1 Tax=Nocardia sp. NPDC057030 TaxID=3346005 RepID=UPI003639B62F